MRFKLKPFQILGYQIKQIEVEISRSEGRLECLHTIKGEIESVSFEPNRGSVREAEVWKKSCVELFLMSPGGQYLEGNLGLNGGWNTYYFESYRKGVSQANANWSLKQLDVSTDSLILKSTLSWSIPNFEFDKIGVTSIVCRKDGQTEYWALSHMDNTPDFHRPETFVSWEQG